VPFLAAVAAGAVALSVYLATVNPTLPPGDSGDLITAASTFGIAHPPGYPLFAMLGHLFSLLPFGSPAWRVNLMSAVLDAAAVGVIALIIYRVVIAGTSRRQEHVVPAVAAAMAGFAGALFLAFGGGFWSYSLVAEVFALNNLLAAALLLLAFTWYRDPRRRRVLWAFFLASGLSVCNQQTIVLLAPGLAVFLIGGVLRIRSLGGRWASRLVRDFAIGVGFLLAGLLPYLYLPIAAAGHPPAMWGDPSTLERFIAVVTRADYGSFALVAGGQHGAVSDNLAAFARYLFDAFGPAGCALSALGLWWLARYRRLTGIALVLSFLAAGPLFLAYANPPIVGLFAGIFARFYILPSIPFAVILGCGCCEVVTWVSRLVTRTRPTLSAGRRLAASGAIAALLVALCVAPAAARYSTVDQSSNYMTINFIKDLLAPLDPGAILLTEGDTAVLGTWYAQNVEGYRPDVVVIAVPLLHFQWYIDDIRRQHPDVAVPFNTNQVAGQPVTEKIVGANFANRPIYYVGVISEAFPGGYGEIRTGFARKFVLTADAADPFAFVRANLGRLTAYRFPTRGYPPDSWENWESTYYGDAAFDLANAYESTDVAAAEHWYHIAIELAPGSPAAYKNLAILLSGNRGGSSEVAGLLETYLRLAPQDPQAATIRQTIAKLRGSSP
jgi:hypothetical protein